VTGKGGTRERVYTVTGKGGSRESVCTETGKAGSRESVCTETGKAGSREGSLHCDGKRRHLGEEPSPRQVKTAFGKEKIPEGQEMAGAAL
jgi:hypothetical protein